MNASSISTSIEASAALKDFSESQLSIPIVEHFAARETNELRDLEDGDGHCLEKQTEYVSDDAGSRWSLIVVCTSEEHEGLICQEPVKIVVERINDKKARDVLEFLHSVSTFFVSPDEMDEENVPGNAPAKAGLARAYAVMRQSIASYAMSTVAHLNIKFGKEFEGLVGTYPIVVD